MTFSRELIRHAMHLVAFGSGPDADEMRRVSDRRAVSAAYYALFHHITGAAVQMIAPNVSARTNHRIQRWFDHGEMKKVCGRFVKQTLEQPLLDLIGTTTPSDLRTVARNFIDLQEARHSADYDLDYELASADARQLVLLGVLAMAAWDRIATTPEANIFILSLLMWKNWDDKTRP